MNVFSYFKLISGSLLQLPEEINTDYNLEDSLDSGI